MSLSLVQGRKNKPTGFDELKLLYDKYYQNPQLSLSSKKIDGKGFLKFNNRLKEIIENNVCYLVADLQTNPSHFELYSKIKDNLCVKILTKRASQAAEIEDLKNSIESTIDLIQKVAKFLQPLHNRESEKKSRLRNVYKDEILVRLLRGIKDLKLPENIDEIREISNPDIRASFIASIINRDNLPIMKIGLSKEELMLVAPHLTYLCYKDGSDEFWSKNEIDAFLNACVNLKTLIIKSTLITHLPALNSCELLNCKGCENLVELPPLPVCKELNSRGCKKLTELPPIPSHNFIEERMETLGELVPLPASNEPVKVRVKPFQKPQVKQICYY